MISLRVTSATYNQQTYTANDFGGSSPTKVKI
jgi:hypothetical protein